MSVAGGRRAEEVEEGGLPDGAANTGVTSTSPAAILILAAAAASSRPHLAIKDMYIRLRSKQHGGIKTVRWIGNDRYALDWGARTGWKQSDAAAGEGGSGRVARVSACMQRSRLARIGARRQCTAA
ncbi:hypothetical protein E2562_024840 [Oryza meyeriana var. granulata]|uniref:Uncharacterized protein n=1 Tax=Oryza meyeriana var. granulata TaxID=110450 RepID=A0A6G1FBV2_9ORYZ|nr:hypothetical protein E2562_024840 [Oryza meyeriana var. granulata]